jgi:hypothetical protein
MSKSTDQELAGKSKYHFSLRGPPDHLTGLIELTNTGSVARHLRSLRLKSGAFKEAGQPGRSRITIFQQFRRGQSQSVPVMFSIDQETKPGFYDAVFSEDAQTYTAQLEVLPREKLSFLPRTIEVTAAAGNEVKISVVLSNKGNVPLELSGLGQMVLEEEQQLCLAIQHALAVSQKSGAEQFVQAMTTHLAEKKVDFLRLKIASGKMVLGVGAAELTEIVLKVPENARNGRRYQAQTVICGGQLRLKLHTLNETRKAAAKEEIQ